MVMIKAPPKSKRINNTTYLNLNSGVKEVFDTLKIEGEGIVHFGNNPPPGLITSLTLRRLLIDTDEDFLKINQWVEYFDYLLVSRAFAPGSDVLGRIHFIGWAPGAKLRDYNNSHWEIVPYGSPEPATYGAILGAVGIGLVVWRKKGRRRAKATALVSNERGAK